MKVVHIVDMVVEMAVEVVMEVLVLEVQVNTMHVLL